MVFQENVDRAIINFVHTFWQGFSLPIDTPIQTAHIQYSQQPTILLVCIVQINIERDIEIYGKQERMVTIGYDVLRIFYQPQESSRRNGKQFNGTFVPLHRRRAETPFEDYHFAPRPLAHPIYFIINPIRFV